MDRSLKNNKFSSVANFSNKMSFRDSLTDKDRYDYDNLTDEMKIEYENFYNNQINGEKSVAFFIKTNLSSNNEIDDNVKKMRDVINVKASIHEEAGKNLSIYLSNDTLNLLTRYMKENKIKNRSKLIEQILLAVLKG